MSFNKQTMLFNKQTMSLSLKCKINRSYFPIRLFSCTPPSKGTKINKWINYNTFIDGGSALEEFKTKLFSDNKIKFNYDYALLTKIRKGNKFYTIGNKQLGVKFMSIDDVYIKETYETIIDRLEVLFEEYPQELEYTCDSVLLEFHEVTEIGAKVIKKIGNVKEAKEKLSKESFKLGNSAFNILGGLDITKTAYPANSKRKYSTSTSNNLNTDHKV